MTGNAPAAAGSGNRARRWERGLLAALAGLSALAWLATWRWPMPGMRLGILTGSDMRAMGGAAATAPMALGLFLLTWTVMMAAMMLPAAAPVVLAVDRWARRTSRPRLTAIGFIAGYLADWAAAGLGAYAVLAGLEHRYPSPGPAAVRAGAVLLVAAGLWQLTPVKHACLRRCRSPLAFLAASTGRIGRGRLGTVRAGAWHGAFCLGCCWSLMLVLLLLGMMNLAWMALVAAAVSAEKILPSARVVAAAAAAALIIPGAALFAVPHLLTVLPGALVSASRRDLVHEPGEEPLAEHAQTMRKARHDRVTVCRTAGDTGDDNDAGSIELGRLYESARVEAFSDGVLAIAITLLVLDLNSRSSPNHVLASLLRQWPAYLAYLASFGFIGVIWVNHHQLFTRIAAVDTGLLWRNLALLLAVSVLPFPTAVLSTAFQHGNRFDEMTASVFYGVAGGVASAAWLALYHYLFRNDRLLARGALVAFFADERRRALVGIVSYLLAALIALWEPVASLVILCALPVFYGVTSEGWRGLRRRRRPPPSS